MEKNEGIINISLSGINGLIDAIIINTANTARLFFRRWEKAVKKNEVQLRINLEANIWDYLGWFIGTEFEEFYPCEEVDGSKIYKGLLDEFIEIQNKVGRQVIKPNYITLLEEQYESKKSN